jgi:hypothetical protein
MTASATPHGRWPALTVASAGYFFVLLDVTIVNVALARIGVSEARAASCSGSSTPMRCFWRRRCGAPETSPTGSAHGACSSRSDPVRHRLDGLCAGPQRRRPDRRPAQGLGAAAILPSSLAIVNQLFPDPAERPAAIGIWAGLGGSALVLGPLLGGALVGPFGWRAIFWANVPLVLGALTGGLALLPVGPVARAARPDLPGQVLGTADLAGLVFTLIEGGHAGFASIAPAAGAAVALAALIGFVRVERRTRRPLLDLGWFARPEFGGANAGSALMNLGTLGGLFALGLYLQQSRGLSPLAAGLNLVPLALPLTALTPFTGRLVRVTGAHLPAGLGLLASGAGYLGTALLGGGIDNPVGWAFLALAGAGMGVAVPALDE